MANTILTPTVIAREALFHLENNLVMGRNVYRKYEHEFVKVGDTVNIRKPVQFEVTDGATLSKQNVTETNTSIVISSRKHVAWGFDTQSLTLSIEEYSKRYIQPGCIALANQVDVDLLALYTDFYTSAGTAGTTPNTFSQLGNLAAAMDRVPVPDDGERKLVLNPTARWAMADALKGIFDASMPKEFVRKGLLGRLANMEIYGDQNVARHQVGSDVGTGTPLVDTTTSADGDTSILTDGWSTTHTAAVRKGDVFTIAGVFSLNRVSKVNTGQLQQFVATADANSDGGGHVTIALDPPLKTTGAYATISALPANDAALTFFGSTEDATYAQNIAFHRNAIALCVVPLELPDGASWKARVEHDGLSIRIVKDYDVVEDEEIVRLDILYGTRVIYPELGARLWGE